MTVKLTGAEFNEFMQDATVWHKGCWYEEDFALVDGEESNLDEPPADAASVEIGGGYFYTGPAINSVHYDFEKVVRTWLKDRTVATLVIEVPKAEVEDTKLWLKAKGFKVK